MGVDHGGGEAGVAERFLHQADVFGLTVELGGVGVAQYVRVYVFADAGLGGAALLRRPDNRIKGIPHLAQRVCLTSVIRGDVAVGGCAGCMYKRNRCVSRRAHGNGAYQALWRR